MQRRRLFALMFVTLSGVHFWSFTGGPVLRWCQVSFLETQAPSSQTIARVDIFPPRGGQESDVVKVPVLQFHRRRPCCSNSTHVVGWIQMFVFTPSQHHELWSSFPSLYCQCRFFQLQESTMYFVPDCHQPIVSSERMTIKASFVMGRSTLCDTCIHFEEMLQLGS